MEKITKREMFETLFELADLIDEGTLDEVQVSAQAIKDFCGREIDLLDKKAVKAKERAAKKAKEGDALTDLVRETLTDEFQTIPEVALTVCEQDAEATTAKVQYRLTKLVEAGVAEKTDVVIPATETAKARKAKGYRLASTTDSE